MTPGTQLAKTGVAAPLDHWRLSAAVRLTYDGPVLEREPVTRADLDPLLAEQWFHGCVRRGEPHRSLDSIDPTLEPLFEEGAAPRARGFVFRTTNDDGSTYGRTFTMMGVSGAARRASARLIAAGRLKVGDTYSYGLEIEPAGEGPAEVAGAARAWDSGSGGGVEFRTVSKDPPLTWLETPLAPWLEGAAVSGGAPDARWCPVLYTREAREQAERYSRLGAQKTPAVESGAALVGALCRCPETGEMFTVVTKAVEVFDATATEFSLEYTADSWQRVTSIIDAMNREAPAPIWRLAGQSHGHPFLPADGAPPCEACANAEVCGRTSVFVSSEDERWTRAVFCRQPYALSHIFGVSARHMRPDPDEVEGLFGMSDGRLLRRGYHVIDEFDASSLPAGDSGGGGAIADPIVVIDDTHEARSE